MEHFSVQAFFLTEIGPVSWNKVNKRLRGGFFYMEHFSVPWTFFCSGVLFNRDWTCSVEQSEQTFELFTSVPPLPLSL